MYTLVPPSHRCFISNLALIGQAVSEKIFEYNGDVHVHWPRVGADQLLRSNFFRIINLQSVCPFPSSFSLQMTF